jgi:hypothetical protein
MRHFFICFGDVLVELEVEVVNNECNQMNVGCSHWQDCNLTIRLLDDLCCVGNLGFRFEMSC